MDICITDSLYYIVENSRRVLTNYTPIIYIYIYIYIFANLYTPSHGYKSLHNTVFDCLTTSSPSFGSLYTLAHSTVFRARMWNAAQDLLALNRVEHTSMMALYLPIYIPIYLLLNLDL